MNAETHWHPREHVWVQEGELIRDLTWDVAWRVTWVKRDRLGFPLQVGIVQVSGELRGAAWSMKWADFKAAFADCQRGALV